MLENASTFVSSVAHLFDVRVSVAFIDPPSPPPVEEGARVVISVSATERLIGGRKLPAYPTMGQK